LDSENCSCPLSQKPVQKRFLPRKGVAFSAGGVFEKKIFRCGRRFRVIQRKLRHGAHPVLQWCAANAVVPRDPAGECKFDRAKSTGRIDALVALAMALSLALLRAEKQIDIRVRIG
jgi:Terminase large subunit, endonuclease domain